MRRLKIGVIILSAALMVCGCNSPQDNAETTTPTETTTEIVTKTEAETTTEYIKQVEETAETSGEEKNILFEQEYNIGNDTMEFIVGESNGEFDLHVWGKTTDPDNATIMLLASMNTLQDIGYDLSILLNYNDLYILYSALSDGTLSCVGTNSDGSTVLTAPDWINSDIDLNAESNSQYFIDVLNTIKHFTSDFTSTEYEPIETTSSISDNKVNSIVYEDEYIRVEYNGVEKTRYSDGSYDIIVTVENLTDQSMTVQAREMSINGYMVDPIYSCDIAAGKKSKEGMRISSDNAKDCPISDIENIETRFICYGSGFNSLEKTEPIVLYQK